MSQGVVSYNSITDSTLIILHKHPLTEFMITNDIIFISNLVCFTEGSRLSYAPESWCNNGPRSVETVTVFEVKKDWLRLLNIWEEAFTSVMNIVADSGVLHHCRIC